MPVRIRERNGAGGIEMRDLCGAQIPTDRAEVLPQLFLVSRTNDMLAMVGRCRAELLTDYGLLLHPIFEESPLVKKESRFRLDDAFEKREAEREG